MFFGKILIGACAKTKKKLQTTLILTIEIIVQPIIGRDIPSKSFEIWMVTTTSISILSKQSNIAISFAKNYILFKNTQIFY